MIHLSVTIVHNKSDADNEAQLQALLPLVTKVTDTNPVFDDQGVQIGTVDTYHYEITGLTIAHQVRFYQVVPFGVTQPPSFYLLDSHNVLYGKGDEDKTGDHPRFFNWGLKRGTDQGADLSIYLADPVSLSQAKLRNALLLLKNDTEYVETAWGKIGTLRLLKQIGQLKEDRTLTQAITDYKLRITGGGLKTG